MKKSSIVLVIMIAVSMVFVAVGILVVRQRIQEAENSNTANSNTPNVTPPAGPNTYTNTQFGFQFSYPSDFSDPTNNNLTSTPATATSAYFSLALKSGGSMVFNAVPVASDEIDLAIADLVSRHTASIDSQSPISLGDESAIRATFKSGVISMGTIQVKAENEDVIFVRHGNNLIWIELKPDLKANPNANDLFEQVLNSFMFSNVASSDANPSTTTTNNSNSDQANSGSTNSNSSSTDNSGANSNSSSGSNNSNSQAAVQPFTISVTDSSATPDIIVVPSGTIVELTLSVPEEGVNQGGLNFKSDLVNSGVIPTGTSKTIAFTATNSFDIIPYWPTGTVDPAYKISVEIQ